MKRTILTTLMIAVSGVVALAQPPSQSDEVSQARPGCSCENVRTERMTELLERYPAGGAPLADTLAATLLAGEVSVDEVVCATRELTGPRVLDCADGLAEAMLRAGPAKPQWVRTQIERLQCATIGLQSAFYAARAVSVYAGGVGKTPAPVEPISRSRP